MSDQLKLYHKALPFFLIPSCLLVIASYGRIGYATLTGRLGHHGNLYYYYELTRPAFYVYCFSLAGIAAIFLVFQLKYFIDNKPKDLVSLFWMFMLFVLVMIICELYLSSGFERKG